MHHCLRDMNQRIARRNQCLEVLRLPGGVDGQPVDVPVIATAQAQTDGPDPSAAVVAAFCPFCGERLRHPIREGESS